MRCCVPLCVNRTRTSTCSPVYYHRFPKNAETCRLWLLVMNHQLAAVPFSKAIVQNLRVCSDHFSLGDYKEGGKRDILKPTAVPSKRLPTIKSELEVQACDEYGTSATLPVTPPQNTDCDPTDWDQQLTVMLISPERPTTSTSRRPLPGTHSARPAAQAKLSQYEILEPIDFSTKDEPSEDPAYEEMEVILSSDDFLSEYESPEEEEKKKKTKKTKRNSSSDEWEPPAQGTAKDSENSEMSVEEEEDEESDGSNGLADDGSMPVVGCEECGSEARLQCSLLRHEKVFACPKCVSGDGADTRCLEKLLVRFADYNNFQIHAEQEHGVTTKRVLCQECGVFYMKPTEANGKKEHVCEYKTKHFVCSNCDKRFRTEKGLKAHTQKLHGNMVHPCKYCLTPFRNRPAKLEHEENHPKEEKPYLCPDCPEKFRNIVKRNRHLRSHRGPWKYICKTCGKGFPHLDRLERHELIHSGEKPFRCEVCDRSFSQDGHLKSHMRLHTGEKPYKCTFCEKCFNHNVSLKSHVLRYHSSEAAPPVEGALENSVPKTKKKKLHPLRPRGRPKRVLGNEEQENGESRELS